MALQLNLDTRCRSIQPLNLIRSKRQRSNRLNYAPHSKETSAIIYPQTDQPKPAHAERRSGQEKELGPRAVAPAHLSRATATRDGPRPASDTRAPEPSRPLFAVELHAGSGIDATPARRRPGHVSSGQVGKSGRSAVGKFLTAPSSK